MPVSESGTGGRRRRAESPHFRPLAALTVLALVFWGRVLFTAYVLLPGAMLSGFLPFGGNPKAPWTILQWDSLAQYYPWRLHAARSLHAGLIPLWNPYQFTGTPFLANLQSAVFYPPNLLFWILDPAYAFGVSALFHSLLASFATYFLARRWGLGRAGGCLAGAIYAYCGYLSAWAMLPTLSATAAWLPVCLLLLEKVAFDGRPLRDGIWLALAITCALLAGHAQIFFYVLLALGLRLVFLGRPWLKSLIVLEVAGVGAVFLAAAQLIPTLELAKLGHRAGGPPSAGDWDFVSLRALHLAELPGLFLQGQAPLWGSLSENFGYVGAVAAILAACGIVANVKRGGETRSVGVWFAVALAAFGLLYALATPLAKVFFFYVPGISQMGGTGRVLLLWSFGIAMLAGSGLDFARRKIKSNIVAPLICGGVLLELFAYAYTVQPVAQRASIYPDTEVTKWLQAHSGPKAHVLFYTPKKSWLPEEGFREPGRRHPDGVLPPNGATVYGIYDVNGYDSLSPAAYHKFLATAEEGGPTPALNGNMVLVNNIEDDVLLDELGVRYIVTSAGMAVPKAKAVFAREGCTIWERPALPGGRGLSGSAFYPGWSAGGYEPESFRFGGFLSLVGVLGVGVLLGVMGAGRKRD